MSEWVGFKSPSTHYRSYRRRVFPVSHLHWYWQPNKNNPETEHTNNTNNNQSINQFNSSLAAREPDSKTTTQKVALVNSTTYTLKKPRPWDRIDRAWFSHLLRHLARKRSGSILTTPHGAWFTSTTNTRTCLRNYPVWTWHEARYNLTVLNLPLNTNQPTNQRSIWTAKTNHYVLAYSATRLRMAPVITYYCTISVASK